MRSTVLSLPLQKDFSGRVFNPYSPKTFFFKADSQYVFPGDSDHDLRHRELSRRRNELV